MQADLYLNTKQAMWETPRNIALIVGAVAAIAAAGGLAGYKLGSQPPATIVIQPGAIQITPPPAPHQPGG